MSKSARRSHFIQPLLGVRASKPHMAEAATHAQVIDKLVAGARVTYRRRRAEEPQKGDEDQGRLEVLREVSVSSLCHVRRPTSHKDMTNYVGWIAAPNDGAPVFVPFESFNEQFHLRDLMLTRPVRFVATQPFRIEYVFPRGVGHHTPDLLVELSNGDRVLVDVTRESVVESGRGRAAFTLMAAAARVLGWKYEVRTDGFDPQRRENVDFLWSYREFGTDDTWDDRVAAKLDRVLPLTLHAAAFALGGGPDGLRTVWQAIARQRAFVDLDRPLRPDTVLHRSPLLPEVSWLAAS